MDLLERVHIHATKLVRGLAKLSMTYESRLKSLGLYSLYCWRQQGDLIETFKILKGYYNINCEKFFTRSTIHHTRGHNLKLFKQQSRSNLRLNFFTQRVINNWNKLPINIIQVDSVALFKHELDYYWTNIGYGYEQRPGA